MEVLDLARWQFGITTVYHFLFVPLTIGLAALVAAFKTTWLRTRNDKWLRATTFWGKVLLINFAMGVVPASCWSFQFGMNWSSYSGSSVTCSAHRSRWKRCSRSSSSRRSSACGSSVGDASTAGYTRPGVRKTMIPQRPEKGLG